MSNKIELDLSRFEGMLQKLDKLGQNAQETAEKLLQKYARIVQNDVLIGLEAANLPARGKYSTGTTREAVISDFRVTWEGDTGSIPVGFDLSKPGAGGYLITGTPKMQPDRVLNSMFKQKKYMAELEENMCRELAEILTDAWMRG